MSGLVKSLFGGQKRDRELERLQRERLEAEQERESELREEERGRRRAGARGRRGRDLLTNPERRGQLRETLG